MAGTFDQMPDADTTYRITDYETGGTWKFQTTEPTTLEKATLNWQKIGTGKWMIQVPAGTADRGATIREDPLANEPNKRKGYGRMQNNDYIHVDQLNEIYKVRNKLRKTQRGHAWENTFDEENYSAGSGGVEPGTTDQPPSHWWAQIIDNMWNGPDGWNAGFGREARGDGVPFAYGGFGWGHNWGCVVGRVPECMYSVPGGNADIVSQFMYGKVNGIVTLLPHTEDWMAYGWIAPGNPDEGVFGDPTDYQETGEIATENQFADSGTGCNTASGRSGTTAARTRTASTRRTTRWATSMFHRRRGRRCRLASRGPTRRHLA